MAATAAWITYLVLLILFAGRWWVWSVFEATPPVTAVVVPLLLLAFVWFARPVRRWLSVVLVLLLLAGAYLAGYGRGWSGATSASGGIKVFAWNTGYWEMWDDRDDFYAFLRRQDADVYLLQEYLHAKEAAPYNHVFRIDESARLRTEFPGYHLSVDSTFVTLSRLPIVATHHEHVPGTGSQWFWKAAKNQRTDIRIDGRTVSFYNVHLPTPFRLGDNPFRGSLSGVFTSQTARLIEEQATWRLKELDRLRADLAGNPNPAVVAGDFNTPWMDLYPLGSGTEAHWPRSSLGAPHTWPVRDYSLPALWRLDWLYTKGDVAVSNHRLAGGGAFSDHLAQQFHVGVPRPS
ncbi:endonuclease/exonuclease/phosphatase family protein [Nonomuraea sp. NPDC023979]|uniref:endonuclease/exonuclease/phosphatase family protein n=1 Tax=Nonomuraea sp. NPDC023979 TaxID=3154796 RepID=UPI00340357F1